MQVGNTTPAIVPHPAVFRLWLRDCLNRLEVSAARVSRDLGLGRNTVGDFLAHPARSIDMTTAHVLTCYVLECGRYRGVQLKPLEAAANG